jgi:hypothetical protein
MEFNATFPSRYFINLGRREDRRLETEIALCTVGITAERFPAVDALSARNPRGYESAGRYALALSQRLVLRKAKLEGASAVLVLEDDVVFHPELLKRLEEMELPEDWGIFYLGCAHRTRPAPVGQGLVRVQYALDTHAFAVRAPYYQTVINALGRVDKRSSNHPAASDWYLADLHKEIPTYACYPNLAWQANSASDLINGTYSNYTPSGEQRSGAGEMVGLQAQIWGGTKWNGWWSRPDYGDTETEEAPVGDGKKAAMVRLPRFEPKLSLLFLTRGDVHHPDIWSEFVEEGGVEVTVHSHAKDLSEAENGFLAGTAISERHETGWGDISLVRAMLALLKAGLENSSGTHFAFLSESCIPVKSWAEIRRALKYDPRSMIDFEDGSGMKPKHQERISKVRDLPHRTWRTHSQWMVLNREAAQCLVAEDFTEHFSGIFAPDEHYFATVLALRGYPDWDDVNRQTPTWVRWQEPSGRPEEYLHTNIMIARELAAFPGFFARKFPQGSDIGKWGLHKLR